MPVAVKALPSSAALEVSDLEHDVVPKSRQLFGITL
jgi:hypothetical protein